MEQKRRIFQTPEERAAWDARHEESTHRLKHYIDRAKAEIEVESEPPRALQDYIARAQAEAQADPSSELPATPN